MLRLILFCCVVFMGVQAQAQAPATAAKIQWMTWDQAVQRAKNDAQPKKIFIDFYTDWCGWCKRMDATTFMDANVVAYMNQNYYPVKFDAETMDTIVFNGTTFLNSEPTFKKTGVRGKVHILAYSLLEGQLSYPSYAILDANFTRLHILKGYKSVESLMANLLFFGNEEFKYYHNYVHGQWQRNLQLQQQQAASKQKAQP